MKKILKNALVTIIILSIGACGIVTLANPGTNEDPLISLSYITDTLIPEIHEYIDNKIAQIKGETSQGYKVVDVKKGQKVIGDASCEMILRMGTADVISSEKGGLSDVTLGGDLITGMTMPSNHLIIVPLSDGRGVKMTSDGKLMIKGTYTIK